MEQLHPVTRSDVREDLLEAGTANGIGDKTAVGVDQELLGLFRRLDSCGELSEILELDGDVRVRHTVRELVRATDMNGLEISVAPRRS